MAKNVKDAYSEILRLRNEFYQKWQENDEPSGHNRTVLKAKYEAFDKALELMTPSIVDPQPDDSRELDHSVIKMSDQEEPVKPKFKVGDKIYKNVLTGSDEQWEVEKIDEEKGEYHIRNMFIVNGLCFEDQDDWELVEQKSTDNVEPKFKVGQKITDGKETVIVSELLDDGSIRVDTKPSGDCWFDIDVNEVDKWKLVEEPISEDLLDEIHNRWEDDPHTKWPKCPYKDFKNIACHFANWQKEQYINEGISPKDAYFGHLLEESWANGRLSGIHEFKQQMIKDAKLSGWVARDDDGHLHLFEVEPRRIEGNHRWWDRDYHRTTLDDCDFPDLKWKDEPVYVKLIIIKEE